MNRTEQNKKLAEWVMSLDRSILDKMAIECIGFLIDTEDVRYYPNDEDSESNAPYWDSCGDRLDDFA
jgi:hypothetical protein